MTVTCPGCGLVSRDQQLPRPNGYHATGECFSEYGTLLAVTYGGGGRHRLYQLVADAYACQHPCYQRRRDVQAVCLHLMTLNLFLCHDHPPESGSRLHQQMMRTRPGFFQQLAIPDLTGITTHRDVALSPTPAAMEDHLWRWAAQVWHAWADAHPTIEEWNRRLVPAAMTTP